MSKDVTLQGEILPPAKKMAYSKRIADKICKLIADGSNLETLGNDITNGLPQKSTLYKWRREIDGFNIQYEKARKERGDARLDRVDGILERLEAGQISAQDARTLIDGIMRLAAIENPRYSDKHKIALEGGDSPILIEHTGKRDLIASIDAIIAKSQTSE